MLNLNSVIISSPPCVFSFYFTFAEHKRINLFIYLVFAHCQLDAMLFWTTLTCIAWTKTVLQYVFFCVLQKKSYRVGTTCGWVNDRIFGCSVCLKLSCEQQWSTCFFFPYSLRYCNMHYMLCCDRMWFTIKNTLAFLNIFHMQKLHHRKICWIRGLSLSFISD